MAHELVRYKPGDAIRWLKEGAVSIRKTAKRQGTSLIRREGERTIGKDLSEAAGALFGVGKSAVADLLHRQAQASEYVLGPEALEVVRPTGSKRIPYSDISQIKLTHDKATVVLGRGSLTITPYAHIVAGRIRVPVGWERNGVEVPYELLIEELAAHSGIEVEED